MHGARKASMILRTNAWLPRADGGQGPKSYNQVSIPLVRMRSASRIVWQQRGACVRALHYVTSMERMGS